jgi:hypothetical protein
MKFQQIIKYLRLLKNWQPEGDWLQENKQAVFEFMEKNPVKRFISLNLGGVSVFDKVADEMFGRRLLASVLATFLVVGVIFGGSVIFAKNLYSPGNLGYSFKLFGENVNCFLLTDKVRKIDCEVKQAEKRLSEIQEMMELKGTGHNREVFEITLQNYVSKLKQAEYSFVRLAAVEEDPALILEAAKQLERAKEHQEVIAEVEAKTGSVLEDVLKEAQIAAVDASAEADKQILRAEVSVSEEADELSELPSVKELTEKVMDANSEILNLETVIMTLKSFHGYVVLIEADEKLSLARRVLSDARNLMDEERYIEVVDKLADVSKLIVEAKEEIKKIEPNLNLNLQ